MKLLYFVYIWMVIIKFSQSAKPEDNTGFRLPSTVIPEHYTLTIKTILQKENYRQISSVRIQIKCIKSTNKITLHARDLDIKIVQIEKKRDQKDDESIKVVKHELEPERHFLHIYLNGNLMEKGSYELEIYFKGEIWNGMAGYYRSSYKDETGQKRWIATTQFEPIMARKAFPCFDEPALRARFTIRLGHQKNFTAISNMPIKSTKQNKGGWVWDTFEETLNMPTYIVAYGIIDFGYETTIKSNRYGNTTVKVWARKNSLRQVKFAAKVAPKLLSYFEEYFDIAYPLPKSDLLAVPDFATGAMENWGLITFRESRLLFSPGKSTKTDKHSIASVIAHEIAHYWFGDLVTIKWWTYLWLKEGFATYLARVAVGHLFPQWEIYYTGTLIDEMQAVLRVDALESSRPVSVPIDNPHLIHEIYDSITYSKGSCVIRMMELFLGTEVLRKGLKYYLNKHKYSSTKPDDLWNSITIAAHEVKSLPEKLTVNKIMDTWTEQPGFPLVTVVRDYTSGTVTVAQDRFLENTKKYDHSCYWVPLSYTTKEENDFNATKPKKWLSCPKQHITFEYKKSDAWILFNIQAAGLYRVNYDITNWKLLIKQLETSHQMIHKLNRVRLIDDVMELAMTGHVDFKIACDLLKYVRHDEEFATWARALGKLMRILKFLRNTEHFGQIQTFIKDLVIPVFTKFGNISTIKDYSKFNLLIISTACAVSNHDCEKQSAGMFKRWKDSNGNHTIPLAMRGLIYCQGVKSGDEEEWDFLWERYLESNVATEKDTMLGALGCTQKHWLLVRYLGYIIKNDSSIRPQDSVKPFSSVIKNQAGSYIARSFFYDNVEKIYLNQSPKGKDMKNFLILTANSLRTDREYKEYTTFVEENKKYFKMAHLTHRQTLEKIEIWKNWDKHIYPNIVKSLEQQQRDKESGSSRPETRNHH